MISGPNRPSWFCASELSISIFGSQLSGLISGSLLVSLTHSSVSGYSCSLLSIPFSYSILDSKFQDLFDYRSQIGYKFNFLDFGGSFLGDLKFKELSVS